MFSMRSQRVNVSLLQSFYLYRVTNAFRSNLPFQILELTLLMASYINAIIRQKGITCDVSETPPNRQGMDVKVWDLESSEWPIVPGATVGLL